jgi:hypothetical protein
MNRQLLFCALLGFMTACQHENDIQPSTSSLAGEVTGSYQTNFFLDPSCVAVPADQMPTAELKAESDSTVTLLYTKFFPAKEVRQLSHINLSRQADVVQLRMADSGIGSFQADRIFTNNGMEKQGKVLRITLQQNPQETLFFTGYKK